MKTVGRGLRTGRNAKKKSKKASLLLRSDEKQTKSIEDWRGEFLASAPGQPVYRYVDHQLGHVIRPFLILDWAEAAATLYVGYQLGQKIDQVGDALAYTIRAIGNIANSIAAIIGKLGEIIDAINEAIKVLSRKIDTAFMTEHMSKINTASDNIADVLARLNRLQPADNVITNPYVADLIRTLQQEATTLQYAINGFAAHDGSPPTIASFISCASPIALYAQAYTYIERYKPVAARVGIWDTRPHARFLKLYTGFFDYTESTTARFLDLMDTKYFVPGFDYTCTFDGLQFKKSKVPFQRSYPSLDKYDKLFAVTGSDLPLRLCTTGYEQFPLTFYWIPIDRMQRSHISDPALAAAAAKWHQDIRPIRRDMTQFLADYQPVLKEKAKTLAAFVKPPGW